jgi:hypothetical protein
LIIHSISIEVRWSVLRGESGGIRSKEAPRQIQLSWERYIGSVSARDSFAESLDIGVGDRARLISFACQTHSSRGTQHKPPLFWTESNEQIATENRPFNQDFSVGPLRQLLLERQIVIDVMHRQEPCNVFLVIGGHI